MTEFFAGPTMVLTWTWSGGSVAIAGDYRTCTWAPTADFVESQAGPDTHKSRLATLKDATATIQAVLQTGGTILTAATQPGVAGTLIIAPEGTATGKRKITFPSYSQGPQEAWPYADIAVTSVSFIGNGTWTDGVY